MPGTIGDFLEVTVDSKDTVITYQIEVCTVTPEMAQEWLGSNTNNRNLRTRRVAQYAMDMKEGDWHFNGDPIRFATDGTLLDGQHRLHAIIESGLPQLLLVMRGLRAHQQHTLDQPVPRTTGDALRFRGERESNALKSVLGSVGRWEQSNGDLTKIYRVGDRTWSTSQLLLLLERYPHLRECVPILLPVQKDAKLPMSVTGGLWFAFNEINPEDCEFFFTRLASAANHSLGDPIFVLREQLLTLRQQNKGKNGDVRLQAAITIKAWNLFRKGEDDCKRILWRRGGANPEPFPQPR